MFAIGWIFEPRKFPPPNVPSAANRTLPTCGIFAFFLARQPQGVLLHRSPPLKPCANEFSLLFSYIILDIDATLKHNKREKQGHLHKV
jgi:hypothetical protein